MGADMKQLRNRIKNVNSIQHLTHAMGLLASSKLRRAMEDMMHGREYEEAMRTAIEPLFGSLECRASPYMRPCGDGNRTCLVVIAGDRGLAGGYYANVFRALREYMPAELISIGKRAHERLGGSLHYAEHFDHVQAEKLAARLCRGFVDRQYDRVAVLGTHYSSAFSQQVRMRSILPITAAEPLDGGTRTVFEPDECAVFNAAIPEYVAAVLMSTVRECFACEVVARRAAMDSAGKNAQQMLDALQSEYNRARQDSITREITEIVAGSDD